EDELHGLLKLCGADRLIEEKTSSDDADRSKPDPDIVHVALEELGRPARRSCSATRRTTSRRRAGPASASSRCAAAAGATRTSPAPWPSTTTRPTCWPTTTSRPWPADRPALPTNGRIGLPPPLSPATIHPCRADPPGGG